MTITNLAINHPIQISQIIAIDIYGINVAYNKSVTVNSTGAGAGAAASVVGSGSITPSTTPYKSSGSSTSEYLQIDLGGEYEIVQIIYVNSSTNPEYSTGCKVSLLDSLKNVLSYYAISGGSTTITYSNPGYAPVYNATAAVVEAYTLRDNSIASLNYSPTASLDSVFRVAPRARYVRFENPTGNFSGLTISNLEIYDMYGKNISIGKLTFQSNPTPPSYDTNKGSITISPALNTVNTLKASTTGYTTLGIPGDWWEIDCGQVYSIRDIVVTFSQTSISVPYVLYDTYRTEVFRGFTTGNQTIPFTLHVNPIAPKTFTQMAKYIRITRNSDTPSTATFNLKHLAIIDSRGMDVSVWRPVQMTDNASNVTYTTVLDGRYTATNSISNRWEINLTSSKTVQNIYSIICYATTANTSTASVNTGFSINIYDADKIRILGPIQITNQSFNSSGQMIKLDELDQNIFTSVQNTIKYGIKTRYITVQNAAGSTTMNFRAIVAIDSLGRNVAYNSSLSYGSTLITPPINLLSISAPLDASSMQIDLGQEHYISFLIIHYPIISDQSLNNATLKISDGLKNVMDTRTLTVATDSSYYAQIIDLTSGTSTRP